MQRRRRVDCSPSSHNSSGRGVQIRSLKGTNLVSEPTQLTKRTDQEKSIQFDLAFRSCIPTFTVKLLELYKLQFQNIILFRSSHALEMSAHMKNRRWEISWKYTCYALPVILILLKETLSWNSWKCTRSDQQFCKLVLDRMEIRGRMTFLCLAAIWLLIERSAEKDKNENRYLVFYGWWKIPTLCLLLSSQLAHFMQEYLQA